MKFKIISLGCPKALVDSEFIAGKLINFGMQQDKDADVVLINTCAFIKPAVEESLSEIKKYLKLKKKGKVKYVGVIGCLYERYGENLKKYLKNVDFWIGNWQIFEIEKFLNFGNKTHCKSVKKNYFDYKTRFISTYPYAYVKIAEGCNHQCTFCIIPKLRGKYISRKIEDILEEVKMIAELGFKEIILVAQDTAYYGIDLYGKPKLAELIDKISKIKGIEFIRIMYMHPYFVNDEILEAFKIDKVCKYFHIPFQHFSDKVLSYMGRAGGRRKVLEIIEKIRIKFPDAFIRSEFIIGFPYETEEDFQKFIEELENYHIERIALFPYYKEEGTKSYYYPALPQNIVDERLEFAKIISWEIMKKAQNRLKSYKNLRIIKENKNEARTEFDAPEVDFKAYGKKFKKVLKISEELDLIMD